MSISNLLAPNNETLYCNVMNATTFNASNENITNLNVANIFTVAPNDLLIQPAIGHFVIMNRLLLANGGITLNSQNINLNGGQLTTASGNLILNANSLIQLNKGMLLPTSGGTPAALNFYQEDVVSITFGGPFADMAVNVRLTRLNNVVTLSIPSLTGVFNGSNALIVSSNSIPAIYFPANARSTGVSVQSNNSAFSFGVLSVSDLGVLQISSSANASLMFTGTPTQIVGMPIGITMTYNILS